MSFEELKNPDFVPNVEILPPGYEKNKDGIFKIIIKDKKGVEIISLSPLSHTPVTVKSKLCNPDTGEVFYNLEFDGKTVTVPGCDLSQKKGIMQLAGQGLLTTEKWARELSEYLIKTIKLSQLTEYKIYDSMGWKEDGRFVLGQILFSKNGRTPIILKDANKQALAIRSSGTIYGWIKTIEGLMEYDTQRFKIYNGVVPPLLKLLNESSYSINDWGLTSIGKTVTTKVTLSIYGYPKDLLMGGGTTRVGLERTVTLFCDLPINLDDIQKIKKELLDLLVYSVGNEVGKLRGAKNGGLQETSNWKTVVLFTGEIPIINDTTFGGIIARLIELHGGLKAMDKEAVKKFEKGIKDGNYGTFGPVLIEYLIKNRDKVVSLHEESLQIMQNVTDGFKGEKETSGIDNRLSDTFATILTAGKVFEELYGNVGGKVKDPGPIVKSIFETVIKGKASETYVQKGVIHIISWIVSNRSNFLLDGKRTIVCTENAAYEQKYKIFGDISDKFYDLLPSELRAELERKKLNPDSLFKEFAVSGLLESDPGKIQKTVRIEKQPVKVYRFNRAKLENMGLQGTT